MDSLTDALTVLWALRYIIALVACMALGCFYAEALHDLRLLRRRLEHLERSDAIFRRHYERRYGKRRPIITGRVIR